MIRDDERKNDICRPSNPPDVPLDFFPGFLHHMVNSGKVRDHDNFCIFSDIQDDFLTAHPPDQYRYEKPELLKSFT